MVRAAHRGRCGAFVSDHSNLPHDNGEWTGAVAAGLGVVCNVAANYLGFDTVIKQFFREQWLLKKPTVFQSRKSAWHLFCSLSLCQIGTTTSMKPCGLENASKLSKPLGGCLSLPYGLVLRVSIAIFATSLASLI